LSCDYVCTPDALLLKTAVVAIAVKQSSYKNVLVRHKLI